MPLGADLVAYLDSASSLTAGTDLFEGPMPELPDACVAITPTGGEGGEYTMGASLSSPGLEMSRFQLMIRHGTQATCISNANTYHALIANLGPTTISGRLYHHVEPIDGEPYSIGQDENLRFRYVANYRAWKARG